MAPSKSKPGLKQGTLFSFFGKKPPSSAKSTSAGSNSSSSKTKQSDVGAAARTPTSGPSSVVTTPSATIEIHLGSRIEVYWPDDASWYAATITQRRGQTSSYYLSYDDGTAEWLDLSTERHRSCRTKENKKRRIMEDDDDDEMELDMDDDASEYSDNNNANKEDEEEDDWMVTDDEDDAEISGSTKKAKVRSNVPASAVKMMTQSKKKTTSSLAQFSAGKIQVTEYASSSTIVSQHTPISRSKPRQITPESTVSPTHMENTLRHAATSPAAAKALPTEGAVNAEGTHIHNHLPFVCRPVDIRGHSPSDPCYDPRTLQLRENDWKKLMGKKMTDAVKQWWDLKSQYFDTVLLFKTGKFYEMFHMDADIGVRHLNLKYMKGTVAHAGFPEVAYGSMADKLVRAGFKVARVEQTETPDQLKERKKTAARGSAPKVVNREVCSILTLGTRTFCYLDDTSAMESVGADHSPEIGPLLAIREILLEPSGEDQQPVCEYGVTIVDAVRGSVTIGQFADDVLRSRMSTLLTAFAPSEILVEGGEEGVSPTLLSLLRAMQTTSQMTFSIEVVRQIESFPNSTALDPNVRNGLERGGGSKFRELRPWNVEETMEELHRRKYFPSGSKADPNCRSVTRWPRVLRAAVEGNAELALSSLGAALFYLQRNLVDAEILSMGIVKAYIPPESCSSVERHPEKTAHLEALQEENNEGDSMAGSSMNVDHIERVQSQAPTHMALDGTTLHNLEILSNSVDHKVAGSLWSKLNYTKTPHGARLLRAWLLRPLFRKTDIERRLDAVQELVSGSAGTALADARAVLSKCGDIERLLSRIHSMSGVATAEDDEGDRIHPSNRAILYEMPTYTKRKVGDFAKLLHGLQAATQIPELFHSLTINSGLLQKVVHSESNGGCFPTMTAELEWFFDNFDCEKAAGGDFEPSRGMDDRYDEACDAVADIMRELNDYKEMMCSTELSPPGLAKSSWKYINTTPDSKDKYLIELPARITVPDYFILKAKRGNGQKQVNKYRTPEVEELVKDLEKAYEIQRERKARGMELIFMKFDSKRTLWAAAAQATALLDALGSLAQTASKPGYSRPKIVDEVLGENVALIEIIQGRHPCVEASASGNDFIPNDLVLGDSSDCGPSPRLLLLSGPNMGGKSTLLRQTCLIAIMAQLGSFVPADSCRLTPLDRIFTRLGASDRILLNQSTFFIELAETSAALRGATHRSLVIMDELGRGTSTFDGTAIASATVKHLVERNQCISLFATHYHSVLDEWKLEPKVRLGHMKCLVEEQEQGSQHASDNNITFLYTLGDGTCPKSFGINVAHLAGLPQDVLTKAKEISSTFEAEHAMSTASVESQLDRASTNENIISAINNEDWDEMLSLWSSLNNNDGR